MRSTREYVGLGILGTFLAGIGLLVGWSFKPCECQDEEACDRIADKALKVAQNATEAESVMKAELEFCIEDQENTKADYKKIMNALDLCLQELKQRKEEDVR